MRTDVVDNQIDTIGKAFLGLTVACARCHDHKLDPIPTADYYSLYGTLTSSRLVMRTADLPQTNKRFTDQLRALKPEIRKELARVWLKEAETFDGYLLAADRVWRKAPPEQRDLNELSPERLQHLVQALEHKKDRDFADFLHPWIQMSAGSNWTEDWTTLASRYADEASSRSAWNRENFQPFGDFRRGGLSGWKTDGTAQLTGASPSGEFAIEPTGRKAVAGVYPAGVYTHTLSERLNASLWSPLVPKDKKFISMQVVGGRLASHRAVIDNCMLSEDYELLDSDSLVWRKWRSRHEQKTLPYYVELVTKSDNPRFPDRPDRVKWPHPADMDAPFSYFGIARAVLHDVDAAPKEELGHLQTLMATAPANRETFAQRYTARLRDAISAWAAERATDDDALWLQWALEKSVLSNSVDMSAQLRALIAEYRAIDSRIVPPRVFHAAADLDDGYNVPVFKAGNARSPGAVVPRGSSLYVLQRFGKASPSTGSGRLQAAEQELSS